MILYANEKYSRYFKNRKVTPTLAVNSENKQVLRIALAGDFDNEVLVTSEVTMSHRVNENDIWYLASSNGKSEWVFLYSTDTRKGNARVRIMANTLGIKQHTIANLTYDDDCNILLVLNNETINLGPIICSQCCSKEMFNLDCEYGSISIWAI